MTSRETFQLATKTLRRNPLRSALTLVGITIGVAEGTAAWLDVSTLTGRVIQELEQTGAPADGQQRVEITAHTVSGNLRVHRS